ncbi:Thioredoxin-dependent peroxide reductase, mitochondrial [Myotis davidii]|uniref:thioredoxin-dependent peroxiredoxin n=1 Tax=Myotis davidii TaxID=225400 RepID=L5MJL1_MYODS|nr:Thioredoxin-dependent peroxide reductase, mitochondrial [Myotis davidii]
MNVALLSDLTQQISQDHGVLREGPGLALRGLFILDPKGVIKHMSGNDLPVRRSLEESLRLVKAFRFVGEHGESAQQTGPRVLLQSSRIRLLPNNTLRGQSSRSSHCTCSFSKRTTDLTQQISQDHGVLREGPGLALRGLFILDPKGVIKHMSGNDLPVRRSLEESLRLVKAFRFVGEHGESAQQTGPRVLLRSSRIRLLSKNTLRGQRSRSSHVHLQLLKRTTDELIFGISSNYV